jgi:ornithine cyclodeaminase/alanine dehydrogenase-like protein (mu-crystallin family)
MESRKAIRIIKAGEIRRNYSMKKAIDAMHMAFSLMSSGEGFVPRRFISSLPNKEMLMLFKPAYVEAQKRVSVKFLTQRQNDLNTTIPAIQGIVLLIDSVSGEILSIMDGEYLTALRTGASSGLATRFFAAEDARVMALFGCGTQGRTQLEAIACERDIKKLLLFDVSREKAEAFIKEVSGKYNLEMVYCKDVSPLIEADIICTATNSTAPLFPRNSIKEGVHINAVGSFQLHMQELDPLVIRDARVYVDHYESCLKESGDFIKAIDEGIIQEDHIIGEIGNYCLGKIPGRKSEKDITIFKSVGVAIQDYVVASDIYNDSLQHSFGQDINLFD